MCRQRSLKNFSIPISPEKIDPPPHAISTNIVGDTVPEPAPEKRGRPRCIDSDSVQHKKRGRPSGTQNEGQATSGQEVDMATGLEG